MTTVSLPHRFPATAPDITVERSDRQLDPIDCRELQWWFAIPRLGDRTASAWYDIDTGNLNWVRQVVSTTLAPEGDERAVELLLREWRRGGKRLSTHRFACVLEPDRARWLAVTLDGDGSYRLTDSEDGGAGVYRVTNGAHTFTCLRVIDLPDADESNELTVAFVEQSGRTVLYRQYRGRAMDADWRAWRAAHPGLEIAVDDSLFLQRDCTGRGHDVLTMTSFDRSRADM